MIWSDRSEDEESDSSEDERESDDQIQDIWSGSSGGPWGRAWLVYLDTNCISEQILLERHETRAKEWKRKKHRLAWWKPKKAKIQEAKERS